VHKPILLFIINVDTFFISHFLNLAKAAINKGFTVHIATSSTGQIGILREHGIIVHEIKLNRSSFTLFCNLYTLYLIGLHIRKIKPDIVQLFTIKPVIFGGICARILGLRNIISYITGLGYLFTNKNSVTSIKMRIILKLYQISLKIRGMRIICENTKDIQIIQNHVIRDFKFHHSQTYKLIPGAGIDLNLFKVTPFPDGVPIVILPARMLSDKGVMEFVEAAKNLNAQKVNARFCLVGLPDPGNLASITSKQLEEWKRQGFVEIWGHRLDMPQVFSDASIVVLPSYREGMPKSLLEASACGRPIVTTDVPGCRDAIKPNQTGILVPVRDSQALAVAIQTLLEDPHLRQKMGTAGRRRAEELFCEQKISSAHLNIYEEILEGSICS